MNWKVVTMLCFVLFAVAMVISTINVATPSFIFQPNITDMEKGLALVVGSIIDPTGDPVDNVEAPM